MPRPLRAALLVIDPSRLRVEHTNHDPLYFFTRFTSVFVFIWLGNIVNDL